MAQAVSKELEETFDNIQIELIEGDKGEFEVIYYDDPPGLLFSKTATGRFPKKNEIITILDSR